MNYMFATIAEYLCKEAISSCSHAHVTTIQATLNWLSNSITIGLCGILRTLTSILEGLLSSSSQCFSHRLEIPSMSVRSFSGTGAEYLSHQAVHLLGVFGIQQQLVSQLLDLITIILIWHQESSQLPTASLSSLLISSRCSLYKPSCRIKFLL